LKPERWGSPLVQEKYQAEKACEKRHPYLIILLLLIIIIIIIIIIISLMATSSLNIGVEHISVMSWTCMI